MPISEEERISRLKERKAKIDKQLRDAESKRKKNDRKARTRELIEFGGLVRIPFPEGTAVDKGILLGALIEVAEAIKTDTARASDWKRNGDAEIRRRQEEQAKRRESRNEAEA